MNFDDFFKAARADESAPFDYQRRLACGHRQPRESDVEWLSHGAECKSNLINIPTGLGKTAAVVLAWLWNRVQIRNPKSQTRDSEWPRRLVYCLPMRTLVQQTQTEVQKWLQNLLNKSVEVGIEGQLLEDLKGLAENSPVILMGGEEVGEWDVHPETPAILIGTQDMLLSRALNRGYGMSRYRWPMHFGLLNNDCLWVMDETQLMGVGVETSAQFDGFRHNGKMPTFGECPTWWMSATLDEARLATVDHPKPVGGWPTEKLSDAEQTSGQPHKLITAQKKLSSAPLSLNSTTKGDYAKQLAALIHQRHQTLLQKPHPSGTLTLVVLNRVSRAREVYETLAGGKKPVCDPSKVALIHSRFRRPDRRRHEALLFGQGDRIVIATQAVEAGVDVSARLLITELAPWSSLVQRMGRCNRRADITDAEVLWVDIQPRDEKDELLRPYSKPELDKARSAIAQLTNASPRALRDVIVPEESIVRPVIRRRDLVDLFDTTPDICGQDLDVSRYIRDGEDNDVQFFWRSIEGDAPTEKEPPPHRDELCRVSIVDAAKFFDKKNTRACRWNPLAVRWEEAKAARPGIVYLVDVKSGGYSDITGWNGEPKDKPTPYPPANGTLATYAGDRLTFTREWQTLVEHTQFVVQQTESLAASLACDGAFTAALRSAALWHDVGKAHAEFQKALHDGPYRPDDAEAFYAKSKNPPKPFSAARPYRNIRHELASALAWLLKGPADAAERDLVAYLIAAHHGKVRLSIRSLPVEKGDPQRPDALCARGIWDRDTLPPIPGLMTEPTVLDLSFMKLGEGEHGPSWLARTVALRDHLGAFRLAYLEAILRAADARASRKSSLDPKPGGGPGVSSGMELREEPPAYGVSGRLTPAEESLVADLVQDGLSIQDKFRPESLYKQTGTGHYASNTVEEMQRAKRDRAH